MKYLKTSITLIFCLIFFVITSTPVSALDYYVDLTNGDDEFDGLSWETSTRTIGAVLNLELNPGDKINVAEGIYMEEVTLQTGISLLGGYPSGGGERNPAVNIAVIDGENIHRCVKGAENAFLDGFSLENGFGQSGGGVLHSNISMKVNNCIIRNCVADGGTPFGGGGMYFFMSNSSVSNCVFESNNLILNPDSPATEAMGGAIMMWSSAPHITDCSFDHNVVVDIRPDILLLGGAIWASASSPSISGCLFENNSATSGGGIGWWNCSTPLIEDCIFNNNYASSLGGGICHIYSERETPDTNLWVRNCQFKANMADLGGGLFITRKNRVAVTNCLFTENYASTNGSAICVSDSFCKIDYCTLADNIVSTGTGSGGCLFIGNLSEVDIQNTIIADNSGYFGIELEEDGDPVLQRISYCNVWGHWTNYSSNLVDRTSWTGNISVNPLFTSDAAEPYCLSEPETNDQSQQSAGQSPCIDAGAYPVEGYLQSNTSTRTDLLPDENQVDMGWHNRLPGVFLIADIPFAGEHSVNLDTTIQCRLMNLPSGVEETDITATLNNQSIDLEINEIYSGYELTLLKTGYLEQFTVYDVKISVEFAMGSRDFNYSFATSPSEPEPDPPVGVTMNLNFPMQQTVYSAGETLDIQLDTYNPWLNLIQWDLHVAFEYAGEFYFYPLWDLSLHAIEQINNPGQTNNLDILELFVPNDITSCGPFNFYAVCMESDTLNMSGDFASWSMYFSGN